jgi:MFS family permease
MGKGRWAAVGCATLFALPFCGAGIATIFSVPRSHGHDLAVRIAAGSVFLIAGLAIILGAVVVSRVTASSFQLRQRYPDQPWMWREDWAANAINDRGAFGLATFWIFTIIWNLISFPLIFAMPWREVRNQPAVMFIFLFPVVGVLLFIGVLYKSGQRMKFGASVCHVDRMPIAPGQSFHGELETRVRDQPPNGFVLRLTCVQRISRGRNSSETILWQESQTVSLVTPSYEGARVQFTFAIPADAEVSQSVPGTSQVSWRLEASAEMPGIDYGATFELPVFATGRKESFEQPVWPAPQVDVSRWIPADDSNITIAQMPGGGEEFHVGPATIGRFGFVLFTLIWFGVIAVMFAFGAPIFFPILFSAFGLLIVVVGIDWMIGRSLVRADRAALSIRRTWLGYGSSRTIEPKEITAITTSIGGVQNGVPLYDVVIRCGPKKFGAAKYIRLKHDAEMVAARMRKDIGLATPA